MNGFGSFFASQHFAHLSANKASHSLQIGKRILPITEADESWSTADIILLGCGEQRGHDFNALYSSAPDVIREQLYQMYDWHPSIAVADAGNLLEGASVADSRASLRAVLQDLQREGKIVVLLGGSHDLTLQQYEAFKKNEQTINAAVIDMLIDLNETEGLDDTGFLMDMLTGQPNYIRHFSHIGFQSYNVNPHLLETMDKLRFDCFRLGRVREQLEEIEPVLRDCDLLSIDMKAVRYSDAPFLKDGSPNGFFGDEMCQLVRYAGMSNKLSSLGIYGYIPELDIDQQGAKLIAQMLWYFADGYYVRKMEADLNNRTEFIEYNIAFTGNNCLFLKSKRTGRWWMQLPDERFIPCSYNDYLTAANDEIPERWLREQERIV
jgi:formiminoglutamase